MEIVNDRDLYKLCKYFGQISETHNNFIKKLNKWWSNEEPIPSILLIKAFDEMVNILFCFLRL